MILPKKLQYCAMCIALRYYTVELEILGNLSINFD